MDLKHDCEHFRVTRQGNSAYDGEDALLEALERMMNHGRTLAAYLFGPESKDALEMAMLPDSTAMGGGQTAGGMSYQPVQVIKQKVDRKPPKADKTLRDSPLGCDLHERSICCWPWDPAEAICPCPEMQTLDASAEVQRQHELAPLATLALLLRLFYQGHDAEHEGQAIQHLSLSPKLFSMGRHGLYWGHTRSLESALDYGLAAHYRRWYTKGTHWRFPNRTAIEPLLASTSCKRLLGRAFDSYNRTPGAGVVFGEMGVEMLSPFDPTDDISLLDDIARPLSQPGGIPSKILGTGRRLMAKLGRKLIATVGHGSYHVALEFKNVARARGLSARYIRINHKDFYPNETGVMFLTSAGNLVFLGRKRVPSLNLKQIYLEMDSPHSFVVKKPGSTQTLKFVSAFPETWQTLFKAAGVLKKVSFRADQEEEAAWTANNWLHDKRIAKWRDALQKALGDGKPEALKKCMVEISSTE